ncbi:radical SAM/SPASM domain-containing protein [Candidatus Margulisiibacteriota bacterium]
MRQISKPRIIDLELTDLCDTTCAFCPRDKITRPLGKMSNTTFKNILKQFQAHYPPYIINFSGMGESLLHPKLVPWIKTLKKELPCAIGITTNGLALTGSLAKTLLRSGPDFINISFNGDKQVLDNIKNLLLLRKQKRPRIHITTLKRSPKKDLYTYWQKIGVDGVLHQELHNRGGYLTKKMAKRIFSAPCQIFNNSLFITWEGNILSCCHDLSGKNMLGDLNTSSLNSILKKRAPFLAQTTPFPICKACNDPLRAHYFAQERFISCKK